ncbi:diaminopimelate epimerase [Anaerotignum sp. MB30-C6]|uniref:diaminopimelate epimerase n=1 Tax=Anaerotignum sp. MB30-C6 TaxID=3070814 RepID=UPI0027DBB062|nr:diaminopimelate epimerase [Anaerotignum sp. MB30-C6]WMI81699.1 diaminopimelate epimerase [Anaerotignum sp. MB30-C6]
MHFTKMEGCGNDYIYINCFEEVVNQPEKLAIAMSERHFGVGADGLVLIMPSENADFRMRMFNLDGSEGEMCGNAARCIGKYVYERGLTKKEEVSLETAGGIRYLALNIEDGIVKTVGVDMGEPILEAEKIPVIHGESPVIGKRIAVNGTEFVFTCVSMGNPHGVTFVEDTAKFPVEAYGKLVEVSPLFPNKTNVEFVQVLSRNHINMRVWERGSGETLACGTGACASVVACILNGLCDREVKVSLIGGELTITWNEEDNHVYMSGPAAFSFDGVWLKEV